METEGRGGVAGWLAQCHGGQASFDGISLQDVERSFRWCVLCIDRSCNRLICSCLVSAQ